MKTKQKVAEKTNLYLWQVDEEYSEGQANYLTVGELKDLLEQFADDTKVYCVNTTAYGGALGFPNVKISQFYAGDSWENATDEF